MQPQRAGGEYTVAAGQGIDEVGKVETRGIDQIPDIERNSNPKNMAAAFASVQFCFVIVVFGSLPILWGLGWWSTLTAVTVGVAIGSILIAVMSLSGPLTGTNQSVSSGAYFGVKGRLIGSAIALFTDIAFCALIAWTTGQTLVDGSNILFGTPTGTGPLAIGMLIGVILLVVIGYLGHATLVASYKLWLVGALILQVAMVIVIAPHFHLGEDGEYLLGSFWPTWMLVMTVAISIPIGYIAWPNDYGRRMPRNTNPRTLGIWAFAGMFIGCWIAFMFGAFLTLSFADPGVPFVDGVFAASPTWFAIPLILYGVLGNTVNGGPGVYNSAMDLQSLFFRVRRSVLALVIGVVVLVVAFLGVIVFDAVATIDAIVLISIVVITPWAVITILGMWKRKGHIYADELHTFAIEGGRGPYWFTGGINYRAVGGLAAGIVVGLLFSANGLFTGPFAEALGGVDLSFISAGITGGLVYLVAEALFPEKGVKAGSGEEMPSSVPA